MFWLFDFAITLALPLCVVWFHWGYSALLFCLVALLSVAFAFLPFGFIWIPLILLKIENSKIIFKCVNSVMGLIFNENFSEKRGLWVP